MSRAFRQGPLFFPGAARVEDRNGFEVVLEYEDQGTGPWLVDLSHKAKWDLQDGRLDELRPWGCAPPERPGQCLFQSGRLIGRMNRTQALAWDLAGAAGPIEGPFATDVSDGACLLALVGEECPGLWERMSPLDLFAPGLETPRLNQGPVMHVPCRIVRLGPLDAKETMLIAFSRGYGPSLAEALLDAGEEFGLRPGGEDVFTRLLAETGS